MKTYQLTSLKYLYCILFLAVSHFTVAQSTLKPTLKSEHKIGFIGGIGISTNQIGITVNYDYEVTLFQLQYFYTILDKGTWQLELIGQPQFNTSSFVPQDNEDVIIKGYEYGLNGGVVIRKYFFDYALSLYGLLSAGPHYVSDVPNRQAAGFIFSDNFMIGTSIHLFKSVELDLRTGIRHLSNANLKKPNGGINNFLLNAGFTVDL